MITAEDITQAEHELADAAATLAEAEAVKGRTPTRETGMIWAAAKGHHQQAVARLSWLLEQQECERLAAEHRRGAEKEHAGASRRRAAELTASRDRMTAAISTAQDALLALADAVTDYNVLIQQHAGEMAAQGLSPILDGHTVGSEPRTGVVLLDSEWWTRVEAAAVLNMVAARVRMAHCEPHGYHVKLAQLSRGHTVLRRAAELVGRVEPPTPAEFTPRAWRAAASPPALVGVTEWGRERDKRSRAVEYSPVRPDQDGPKYV